MSITLETKLRDVLGDAATKLKARDLVTVGDFVDFLPRRYLDPTRGESFGDAVDGDHVVVVATVTHASMRRMQRRRGSMLNVTIADDTGASLQLTFFKPYGHEKRLRPGARGVFAGTLGSYRGHKQLTHPDYEIFVSADDEGAEADAAASASGQQYLRGLIPIYPVVEKVTAMQLTNAAQLVLHALGEVPDPVPDDVAQRHGLPSLTDAYRMLHLPAGWDEVSRARKRLAYGEALVIQTALGVRRRAQEQDPARARTGRDGGALDAFRERLPFTLTSGQQQVVEELFADLAGDRPMNRLLQGDVGSGKTVVALLAMLRVVDSGGQAVLLAPTEVLAAQHHRSITTMLGDLAEGGLLGGATEGTQVALLTGSMPTAARRKAMLDAASGEAGIVVGTHALLEDKVSFADLGLVVIDEQHRFGVEQRDALRGKADVAPHVLVMTATPIPRTVAMTVYGDMATSVLKELPKGRSPIRTHVVEVHAKPRWVERTWERVAEEVAAGHQAYVVCPRIGEEDELPDDGGAPGGSPSAADGDGVDLLAVDGHDEVRLRGVHEVLAELRATPALQGLRVEVLHGRMPPEAKDAVMADFAAGDVDVLVSTTVVEVGVDVPNATVMVIMDADRFGLSQLHQLRGRVGRGQAPGLCLLMTRQPSGGPSSERLAAIESTTDGFELARKDLDLRREGDVLGADQSGGRKALKHLRLSQHEDLILAAREDVTALLAADPDLAAHPVLADQVAALDPEQAAFLERG